MVWLFKLVLDNWHTWYFFEEKNQPPIQESFSYFSEDFYLEKIFFFYHHLALSSFDVFFCKFPISFFFFPLFRKLSNFFLCCLVLTKSFIIESVILLFLQKYNGKQWAEFKMKISCLNIRRNSIDKTQYFLKRCHPNGMNIK